MRSTTRLAGSISAPTIISPSLLTSPNLMPVSALSCDEGRGCPNPILICGPLAFDRAAGTITLSDRPLELRRREFAVLEVLMTRAGKLVSKERLIAEVFGFDEPVAPNAAELYVARVRQKLGPDGPRIPDRSWPGLPVGGIVIATWSAVVAANPSDQSGGARHCACCCAWNRRDGADPAGCRNDP